MSFVDKLIPVRRLSSVEKAAKTAEAQNNSIAWTIGFIPPSDSDKFEKRMAGLKKDIDGAVDLNHIATSEKDTVWNPFRLAVDENVPSQILEWLLQAGGNPNQEVWEKSLLCHTVSYQEREDKLEKAKTLIEYGAQVGFDELKTAVENNRLEHVKLFLFALKDIQSEASFDAVQEQAKELVAIAPSPVMAFHVMKTFGLQEASFDIREDDNVLERITIVRDEIL